MTPGLVVKFGGSLLSWREFPQVLRSYLDALADSWPLLIVGGGKMVDVLRDLDQTHGLDERQAHTLAVQTLDVTARVVASLVPRTRLVDRLEELPDVRDETPILVVRRYLDQVDRFGPAPLPECWDCTSDSIAARLADHLGCGLILLKSTAPAEPMSREQAAHAGLVDPLFPRIAARLSSVTVLNLRSPTCDAIRLD